MFFQQREWGRFVLRLRGRGVGKRGVKKTGKGGWVGFWIRRSVVRRLGAVQEQVKKTQPEGNAYRVTP